VPAPEGAPVPIPAESSVVTSRPGDIVIAISPNKLANGQIKTESVTVQTGLPAAGAINIRTTGTVTSNAYKETPVSAIAGGIVREVNVQLGDRVSRGQPLAMIFSSELADAEAGFLKMAAEVDEHHQHHHRTIELLEIGAVSREEMEQATSMNRTAEANLAAARQRLVLLGMSERQVDDLRKAQKIAPPQLAVGSPVSGSVIARTVNTGEVVMQGKEMFRVADLSTVWVVGQIYEKDFQAVNIGTLATITSSAYPDKTLRGRVSYIDPRVDPQTRTAQVRIELSNPRESLKLGMFVDVNFGGATQAVSSSQAVTVVPRQAIQTIGSREVLFLATERAGEFRQREVSTGPEVNGMIPVYSGVNAGDRVVSEGSFLLRAESLKLNPAQSQSHASAQTGNAEMAEPRPHDRSAIKDEPGTQEETVMVTANGFKPDTIKLKLGIPAKITFLRQLDETCATTVVIPDFNVKRALPLNEPVAIELTPRKQGVFKFTCGMGMLTGKIIVQ